MKLPNFQFEKKLWRKGYKIVAGTDEVGRGAFAGPIVAAAVAFASALKGRTFQGKNSGVRIDDSKRLTSRQREKSAKWIKKNALAWGIGEVPASYINRAGLAKASRRAFRRAVVEANRRLEVRGSKLDGEVGRLKKSTFQHQNLASNIYLPTSNFRIQFLLIDAFFIPYVRGLPYRKKRTRRQLAIIHGDQKSMSIAAASIIAKVYRDKKMTSLSSQSKSKYKKYGWESNKGYGTKRHQAVILKYGITRYHRKAFVNTFLEKRS